MSPFSRFVAGVLSVLLVSSVAIAAEPEPVKGRPHIQPFDLITIRVANTLTGQPIDGTYLVEPDGQVCLGPAYGRVGIKDLTEGQAAERITKKLSDVLRQPEVRRVAVTGKVTHWRQAVLPKAPYVIRAGDSLVIRAVSFTPVDANLGQTKAAGRSAPRMPVTSDTRGIGGVFPALPRFPVAGW